VLTFWRVLLGWGYGAQAARVVSGSDLSRDEAREWQGRHSRRGTTLSKYDRALGKSPIKAKGQKHTRYSSPEKRTVKRAAKSPGKDFPSLRSRAAAGKSLPKAPQTANLSSRSRENARLAQPGKEAFSIVGVGASAGGLEAFMELLKHLPADSGLGFVLVQHLDPTHESALPQLLGRVTAMPVSEAANGQAVLPNRVYVIPPNAGLVIQQGVLIIQPRQQTGVAHRSIDHFFRSLAEDQHERAIGVVLSGT